ncbi:MAG: 3'-5' exonuclease [Actinomycetota bacterium]
MSEAGPVSVPGRTISDIDTSPLPLVGLDIETDTTVDGLDPSRSEIVALALSGEGFELVFDGDEATLLAAADLALADLTASVLVTWNGAGFDLPFIARRAARLGLDLGLSLEFDPSIPGRHVPLPGEPARVRGRWHHHRHLDGYQVFRSDVGQTLPVSCGLKPLARFVGLPIVEVDRTRIHELSAADRRAYVASDARLARALVERRADHRRWVDQLPSSSGS